MRHSMACPRWRSSLRLPRQRLPGGHQQLRTHEIEAGDQFRHWMLDLQPRVHLEEVEPGARRRLFDEKLDGACILVAAAARAPRPQRRPSAPQLRRHRRRRALLDDLLVPPLHGAFAFEQRHAHVVFVREDLNLDMPGPFDQAFHVKGAVAKRMPGITPRRLHRAAARRPAAAPPACRCRRRPRTASPAPGSRRAQAASSASSD